MSNEKGTKGMTDFHTYVPTFADFPDTITAERDERDYRHYVHPAIVEEVNQELDELKQHYNELIFGVATKYPDETRHETALRYIREREFTVQAGGSCETVPQENDIGP